MEIDSSDKRANCLDWRFAFLNSALDAIGAGSRFELPDPSYTLLDIRQSAWLEATKHHIATSTCTC
ncbi:uncharacterized protein CLUP02_08911 [Colletotrichum lupini]|uniref:Uncharacterized protein n=1 Tax=Colletotrichum lupini TaxID=145971 RepID=A0A9Q8STW0_9PEZI|nr:uncharacterized protein CLUP02_08911 [Colletotrichum lupini]UQC83416.1 hypothetical protein CLUP02_08911 [Colletotrichum lupini]